MFLVRWWTGVTRLRTVMVDMVTVGYHVDQRYGAASCFRAIDEDPNCVHTMYVRYYFR